MLPGDSAPDFSDPLGLLRACHQRILGFCELLERMREHQDNNGDHQQLAEAAAQVLRYFDIAAPLHHQDEEQNLFPALTGHSQVGALIAQLQAEHQEHDALWLQLRDTLETLREGRPADLQEAPVDSFNKAMRSHVERENQQVLPLAETTLTPDQLAAMGQAMAARRRP